MILIIFAPYIYLLPVSASFVILKLNTTFLPIKGMAETKFRHGAFGDIAGTIAMLQANGRKLTTDTGGQLTRTVSVAVGEQKEAPDL